MKPMLHLTAFYALFMLTAMVWPTVKVWRTTGINPLVLPKGDSVEAFVGTWFKLLLLVLGIYLALGATGVVQPIGSIELPGKAVLSQIGIALLGLSFVWVVVAQWQMGNSWRVGIDSKNRTDLVVRGLFRVSRNPIFLGMMVQLLGLFLAMPDAVSLAVLIAAYVLISVQIRLEEAHLLALQGESYQAYCAKVRRWLG
jgi:protein-S-isoprenylcysteine O-methyltransferase Ste14